MPNIGFSVTSYGIGGSTLFSSIKQSPIKADVFARADPDAVSRYQDSLDISDKLAQGAKDAASFATTKDLEAKKERLKLLKMLAQSATDPRTIRAIAREVAEIARSLGNAAGSGSGGMVQTTAAPSAAAGDAAAASAATATGATASGAAGAEAAVSVPGVASGEAAATTDGSAAAQPQTQSVAGLGGSGTDESIKDQVKELLQLAKKILETLRTRVLPGSRAAEEVEKANREVLKAASAFGISLDGESESSSSVPSSEAGSETTSVDVSATVAVVAVTSVNIKV